MDDGETVLAVFCSIISCLYWLVWLATAHQADALLRATGRRAALEWCLIACAGLLLATLVLAADPVVRQSAGYIWLFTAVAGVALAVTNTAGAMIGVNSVDDALRKPNTAAVWAIGGLWLGTTLCACGANIGRGDTIGTTLFPLAVAVVALLMLWAVLAALTGAAYAVAGDRDNAAGIRQASLLTAWGLILGRAAAGDWSSAAETLRSFATDGWPALALLAVGAVVEILFRPTRKPPAPVVAAGWLPGVAYLATAIGWVVWLGPP